MMAGVLTLFSLSMLGMSGGFDYFTPEHILRFADYLFEEGDYLRAADEYLRYQFLSESISGLDSIQFKIGLCYRMTGYYDRAISYFEKVINDTQSSLRPQSHYQIGLCYFLGNELDSSLKYIDEHRPMVPDSGVLRRMDQVSVLNLLWKCEWSRSADLIKKRRVDDEISVRLLDFAESGCKLPYKSRLLAGLFSTVIPGAGKIYCGRFLDGIQSLSLVAFTGWQAYDGFHKDGMGSIKGWVFGIMGGIFYLGNIYGSTVAADIRNYEEEERLKQKIRVFLNANF